MRDVKEIRRDCDLITHMTHGPVACVARDELLAALKVIEAMEARVLAYEDCRYTPPELIDQLVKSIEDRFEAVYRAWKAGE